MSLWLNMEVRWLILLFGRSQVGNSAGKMLSRLAHLMILLGRYRHMIGQLIPWGRVHMKGRVAGSSRYFPRFFFFVIWRSIILSTTASHWSLSWTRWIQSTSPLPALISLTSTCRSLNGLYPSGFQQKLLMNSWSLSTLLLHPTISFFFILANPGLVPVNSAGPQSSNSSQLIVRNPTIRGVVTLLKYRKIFVSLCRVRWTLPNLSNWKRRLIRVFFSVRSIIP